jgi:dienelactone hydrolase
MSDLPIRDVEYRDGYGTRMIGAFVSSARESRRTAVLLLPDAYGVSGHMTGLAVRLAAHGHSVLVADLWGDRRQPADETEFGPMIGAMVADRSRWLGRVRAAHAALTDQLSTEDSPVALLGYCFGGSSALEYARTGGDVAGTVSIHGGLDIVAFDWTAAQPAPVLLCTGEDDPMATAAMRAQLTTAVSGVGIDWQMHVYSRTVHAFTSPRAQDSPRPDVVAYQPRSAARAWRATLNFLRELDDTRATAATYPPHSTAAPTARTS